ncbi:MAG: hypothetical protein QE263_04335 [Vampirovibrionales bacterium]|nr:hypothetical protein [Vampirovibrionales bacterium]
MSSLASGPVKNTYLTQVIAQADTDKSGTVSLEELEAFKGAHKKDGYLSLVEPEAPDRAAQAKGLASATAMMLREYELFQQATTGGAGISADGITALTAHDLDKTTVSNRDLAKAKKALPPEASAEEMQNYDDDGYGGYGDIYNNTNPYGPISLDRGLDGIFTTSNMLVQQNAQFLDGYQPPPPASKNVADAALAAAPAEEVKTKKWWQFWR